MMPTKHIAMDKYISITPKSLGTPRFSNHTVPGSTAEATTIDKSTTSNKSLRKKAVAKSKITTIVFVIVPKLILIVFSFRFIICSLILAPSITFAKTRNVRFFPNFSCRLCSLLLPNLDFYQQKFPLPIFEFEQE